MTTLQFYFDFLSPYAYLAQTQVAAMAHSIEYCPFDIRALMPQVGNVPTSVICKPKNTYIQADLRRWIARYAVPFERNPEIMSIDNRRLLRATLLVAGQGPVEDVVAALFSAMWGRPRPLATAADVAEVLRDAGVVQDGIVEAMDSSQWDAALDAATERAVEAGVFGAPTMLVDGEMFFGNDRLDFVAAALAKSS